MFTNILRIRSLVAVAVIGACAAAGAPALAATAAPDGDSVTVSFADLNLNQPAGAAVALQRIRTAARAACGLEPQITDLNRDGLYRACVDGAVERSVQTLGSAQVTALMGGAPERVLASSGH